MNESDIPHLPAPPRARGSVNTVVMGVAGSGKTTIGIIFVGKLGYAYAEGGEFHTQANRDKQASDLPLDDADRQPWLEAIRDWMCAENAVGHSTVISCSALKRKYRDTLRENGARTVFAHVAPPKDPNAERVEKRRRHSMNPSPLSNQCATLERLEDDELGFVVDNLGTPEEVFVETYTRLVDL